MLLNQCLYVGPNFGQSILDILIRFRMHKVAFVGDVEKAFLMVGVSERDRNIMWFLWFDDPSSPESTLVKYRFTRVVFGVSVHQSSLWSIVEPILIKCNTTLNGTKS